MKEDLKLECEEKKANENADREVIQGIVKNYIKLEESIVSQLSFTNKHGVTIGGFREEIWKSLFEQIVPKKYTVERSVFIIDSGGNVSNEVDLAIFDEQYTPYIFNYGKMKFIPIEAVAVVVQCKSTDLKPEQLKEWVCSIARLKTSLKSIARMHTHMALGEHGFTEGSDGKIQAKTFKKNSGEKWKRHKYRRNGDKNYPNFYPPFNNTLSHKRQHTC